MVCRREHMRQLNSLFIDSDRGLENDCHRWVLGPFRIPMHARRSNAELMFIMQVFSAICMHQSRCWQTVGRGKRHIYSNNDNTYRPCAELYTINGVAEYTAIRPKQQQERKKRTARKKNRTHDARRHLRQLLRM